MIGKNFLHINNINLFLIVTLPQTSFPFIVVYIYIMYFTLTKLKSLEFSIFLKYIYFY